jgi:hypothetical protein
MLARELDRTLGVPRGAHELELAVTLDDRRDEGAREGIVVGDDQAEGHPGVLLYPIRASPVSPECWGSPPQKVLVLRG